MKGIYIIKNKINNKFYIGSCKDFRKRKNNHLSNLRRNKHHCQKLQRAFNKYGEDNFEFKLIEELTENTLLREQYWINLLNPNYNCAKLVGGHNRKATSEETKAKISASKKNKREVYKFDVENNFIEKYESVTQAAKSVNKSSISHISQCCNLKRAIAYGYKWSYNEICPNLQMSHYFINQFSKDKIFIKRWRSVSEISNYYNIPKYHIRTLFQGKYKTRNKILNKYLWEQIK